MTIKQGLLDDIAMLARCDYLSDLRGRAGHWEVRYVIRLLVPENYSLAEWNEAASYLEGHEHCFESSHEAWTYLGTKDGGG